MTPTISVGWPFTWTMRPRTPRSPPNRRCHSEWLITVTRGAFGRSSSRSEEHTSELQSLAYLVCRLLLEKKKFYSICLQECSPGSLRLAYHLAVSALSTHFTFLQLFPRFCPYSSILPVSSDF